MCTCVRECEFSLTKCFTIILETRTTRLRGKVYSLKGSLNVYYKGKWNIVCFFPYTLDRKARKVTKVACHQLGYSGLRYYGESVGIKRSGNCLDIKCSGFENILQQCDVSAVPYSNHFKSFGIVCCKVISNYTY